MQEPEQQVGTEHEVRLIIAELGPKCRGLSWTESDGTQVCVINEAVLSGNQTARDGAHALLARRLTRPSKT